VRGIRVHRTGLPSTRKGNAQPDEDWTNPSTVPGAVAPGLSATPAPITAITRDVDGPTGWGTVGDGRRQCSMPLAEAPRSGVAHAVAVK
jgi:hypothetical protein